MDDSARDFIKGKLNSALGLIRAVEQRRSTIVRVSESIVRHQRDFFDHGILRMRPLTLREVADDIEMHESTVSRATAGKYAQTPRGLFELRFFFGSGVSTSDGDAASSASVKKRIGEMIASEDSTSPLTDQQIADSLGSEGIRISRRTVASIEWCLLHLRSAEGIDGFYAWEKDFSARRRTFYDRWDEMDHAGHTASAGRKC